MENITEELNKAQEESDKEFDNTKPITNWAKAGFIALGVGIGIAATFTAKYISDVIELNSIEFWED
jgi:hypothetical protein